MARTPLFKEIQRTLKLAAHLEKTHTPTAEGLERIAEAQWSRRRFLGTTAAATAGTMASIPFFERVALGAQSARFVIVGAGTAGLTCAYRLQQAGVHHPRVIEASTRVGGRMFTLRNFFPENQITELGGEYIDTDHKALRRLAEELGLKTLDLYYDNGPSGHTYYFDNRRILTDADFIEEFRPVAMLIKRDLDSMKVDGEIDFNSPNGKKLDSQSITEWFSSNSITGLITKVLRAAYVGEYGRELHEQSALNLLLEIGEDTPLDLFRVFGDSDERYHIVEGNDSVPSRLAQRLERPVEFDTHLEAISGDSNGYTLSVRRDRTSAEIKADVVILAIPYTVLRDGRVKINVSGFPQEKLNAINQLGYGMNAKLIAGFSKRVWQGIWQQKPDSTDSRFDNRSSGYAFTDLPFQCCWETTRGQPGTHGVLTNFAGGNLGRDLNQGTLKARTEDFIKQVEVIFPGAWDARTGQAVRQHWPSSPFVYGSYTCYLPGQYSTLSDWVATPVGNIYFAGEHTSVEFNGYMEGAVESGERAAQEVIRRSRGSKQEAA